MGFSSGESAATIRVEAMLTRRVAIERRMMVVLAGRGQNCQGEKKINSLIKWAKKVLKLTKGVD